MSSPVSPELRLVADSDLDELVERAQADDRFAFEEIVRRTHGDTYSLALRLTSNAHDARDVTQDAYLRVFRSIKKFRAESAFSTWIYRITANCASDHLRRRRRHRHENLDDAEDGEDADPEVDPVSRVDRSGLRGDIEAAVRRLPAKLRSVVVLRDIYDLPHADIADELGIPVATAKVRLHRARRQLQSALFDAGHAPRGRDTSIGREAS